MPGMDYRPFTDGMNRPVQFPGFSKSGRTGLSGPKRALPCRTCARGAVAVSVPSRPWLHRGGAARTVGWSHASLLEPVAPNCRGARASPAGSGASRPFGNRESATTRARRQPLPRISAKSVRLPGRLGTARSVRMLFGLCSFRLPLRRKSWKRRQRLFEGRRRPSSSTRAAPLPYMQGRRTCWYMSDPLRQGRACPSTSSFPFAARASTI